MPRRDQQAGLWMFLAQTQEGLQHYLFFSGMGGTGRHAGGVRPPAENLRQGLLFSGFGSGLVELGVAVNCDPIFPDSEAAKQAAVSLGLHGEESDHSDQPPHKPAKPARSGGCAVGENTVHHNHRNVADLAECEEIGPEFLFRQDAQVRLQRTQPKPHAGKNIEGEVEDGVRLPAGTLRPDLARRSDGGNEDYRIRQTLPQDLDHGPDGTYLSHRTGVDPDAGFG